MGRFRGSPPTFYTSVESHIEIDPEELIEAGWVWRGETTDTDQIYAILHAWHNRAHPGPFRFCAADPCSTLNHEIVGWGA